MNADEKADYFMEKLKTVKSAPARLNFRHKNAKNSINISKNNF